MNKVSEITSWDNLSGRLGEATKVADAVGKNLKTMSSENWLRDFQRRIYKGQVLLLIFISKRTVPKKKSNEIIHY